MKDDIILTRLFHALEPQGPRIHGGPFVCGYVDRIHSPGGGALEGGRVEEMKLWFREKCGSPYPWMRSNENMRCVRRKGHKGWHYSKPYLLQGYGNVIAYWIGKFWPSGEHRGGVTFDKVCQTKEVIYFHVDINGKEWTQREIARPQDLKWIEHMKGKDSDKPLYARPFMFV